MRTSSMPTSYATLPSAHRNRRTVRAPADDDMSDADTAPFLIIIRHSKADFLRARAFSIPSFMNYTKKSPQNHAKIKMPNNGYFRAKTASLFTRSRRWIPARNHRPATPGQTPTPRDHRHACDRNNTSNQHHHTAALSPRMIHPPHFPHGRPSSLRQGYPRVFR